MHFDIHLQQAGLTADEAALYEVLVSQGAQRASTAARLSQVPRTLAYKVLGDLEHKGLVERNELDGTIATFAAVHPQKLKESIEQERKRAKRALTALNEVLPELTSAYNLAIDRPGVRFYEGYLGIKRVLDDSLTATESILSYADLEAIRSSIPEINEQYTKERIRKGIVKKGLVPDTKVNRAFAKGYAGKLAELTHTRFMQCDKAAFGTIMQIYDNKVSYITVEDGRMIGVIIEDSFIYNMHKTLFGHMWSLSGEE